MMRNLTPSPWFRLSPGCNGHESELHGHGPHAVVVGHDATEIVTRCLGGGEMDRIERPDAVRSELPGRRWAEYGHHFSASSHLDPLPGMSASHPFARVPPELTNSDLHHAYT